MMVMPVVGIAESRSTSVAGTSRAVGRDGQAVGVSTSRCCQSGAVSAHRARSTAPVPSGLDLSLACCPVAVNVA